MFLLQILALSSVTNTAMLSIWTLSLIAFAKHFPWDLSECPPIIHCTDAENASIKGKICAWSKEDDDLTDCADGFRWTSSEPRHSSFVRICGEDESPSDALAHVVIPCVVGMLFLSTAICFGLNWLADYRNYYMLSKVVFVRSGPAIHWNLLFDLAEDMSEQGEVLIEEVMDISNRCLTMPNIVRMLLERNDTDVNLGDKDGWTPTYAAASWGHEEVIRLLIGDERADKDAPNYRGETPAQVAMRNGFDNIANVLSSAK